MPPHDRTTTIPHPEPAAPALPTFTGYRNLLGLIRQLSSLGGCAQPIRLEGQRTEIDAFTGEILRELKSKELPAGHLLVRCGNRRTSRCPSCAELYRQDTYHLIAAACAAARTSPTRSPPTPASSPPSPHPHTAPSTGDAWAVPRAAAAGTPTPMATRSSAPRSTPSSTTTPVRCCGTPTPPPCGPASCSTCAAPSPQRPDSRSDCSPRSSGSRTPRSPSTSSADLSTSTP